MESPSAASIVDFEKQKIFTVLGNHGITDKSSGQAMFCQTMGGGQLGKHQFNVRGETGFLEQELASLVEVVPWGEQDEFQTLEQRKRYGRTIRMASTPLHDILAGKSIAAGWFWNIDGAGDS